MAAYHEPTTVEEATALLAADEGARCLAGGASLVAMMNFGMLEPSALVSLRRIEALSGIRDDGQGGLSIGAMTTQRELAGDARLAGANEVVREAARSIEAGIRNMGTIGGALGHADSSSDLNTALVAAGASVEVAGPGGRRVIPVDRLFVFYLTTALEQGEMITAVALPPAAPGSVGAHDKVCRVHGDTATLNAAVTLRLERGVIAEARLAVGGCGPVPLHLAEADSRLVGTRGEDAAVAAACALLAERADPPSDVRGSAEYRRLLMPRVAARLVRRALEKGGPRP